MMKLLVLLSSLALLIGCGAAGPGQTRTERTDSAGVAIFMAGPADTPLDWAFHPRVTLGGEDNGPESFYRVSASTVGVDGNANLYVLDSGERRVVMFDSAGQYVRTMGVPGRGPGEIEAPGSMAVAPDGTAAVFDYAKLALVRFGPDGGILPEVPFRPHSMIDVDQRHFTITGNGYLAVSLGDAPGDRESTTWLHSIAGEDTVRLVGVAIPRPEMVMYPACGGGLSLPPLFAPALIWDQSEDRVAVNTVPEYTVQIFEGGRLVRSLRRELEPMPATRELAVQELGEGFTINFGQGPCTIDAREMADGRGYFPAVPLIAGVRIAPTGEVWVQRRIVGSSEPGPIDVFAHSGEYSGTLPSGTPLPLSFLPNNRALLREVDEWDVHRIVVAEIER